MKKYFQAPWSIKDLIIVLVVIVLAGAASIFILKSLNLENLIGENKIIGTSGVFLLQWVLIFTPLLILTRMKYGLKLEHFGFEKIRFWHLLGTIIAAYLFYQALNLIITIIIIYGNVKISGYQFQENIFNLFGNDNLSIALTGVITVLVAPFLEEIFFRGFLLRTISDKFGLIIGSITTATIFALMHFPWQSFIPIFIIGLVVNGIVIRTKSIKPAIGFHILNNGISFLILLLIEKDIIHLGPL